MKPKLSPKSRKVVAKARRAVAESDKRMATYTPAQRAELEREAREIIGTSARDAGRAAGDALRLPIPSVMLATLKLAYQHALDVSAEMCGGTKSRLTPDQERELGRRLAQYWSMTEEDLA